MQSSTFIKTARQGPILLGVTRRFRPCTDWYRPRSRLSWQEATVSRRLAPTSGAPHMERTDEELVARATAGDVDSFNQLVSRWERTIYALAYRTLGREEDARDVVQEAFLRAYRGLRGFKGEAKFSSWLYRITLNLCRDWIRRERRAPVVQPPEGTDAVDLADAQASPTESVEDLVARREMSRAVATGDGRPAGRAADGHSPEGVPRADVSGNRGPAELSAEHGEDAAVSGTLGAAPPSGSPAG